MRKYIVSLLLLCLLASGANSAADLGNSSVISPVDSSNGSGTCPSWLGSAAPSTLDDSGRCLQGAIAREWQNRSFAVTSSGTAPTFVVAYTVAPAAYRTGQVYSFIAHAAAVGSETANINTLGAKNLKKVVAGSKTALAANDFYTGDFLMFAYDGTDLVWVNSGANAYRAGGTDVALADGGTGSSLADPNADRLMFWDDSEGAVAFLTLGTSYTTSTTTLRSVTESFCVAASDETTALTAAATKVAFRMPYAFTLTDVRASVTTVATGATLLTIDVNEGAGAGTTILSTKLTFDASEGTTTTAATPRVISDSSLADDARITIDFDAVGNTTTGRGVKVCLIGYQT